MNPMSTEPSTEPSAEPTPPDAASDRFLLLFLRLVGSLSLLAFLAAVMPEKWIVEIAEALGFDPFPDSPLTFYLARSLSLLFGFVGALLIVVSCDLQRYRPLVWFVAMGTMLFGILRLVVDSMAALPVWWTLGECLSTLFGGALLYWIQRAR